MIRDFAHSPDLGGLGDAGIDGDFGSNLALAQVRHEAPDIVGFIGTERAEAGDIPAALIFLRASQLSVMDRGGFRSYFNRYTPFLGQSHCGVFDHVLLPADHLFPAELNQNVARGYAKSL